MKIILLIIIFLSQITRGLSLWVQKADFPGTERSGAIGFSIGSKGYVGIGRNSTIPYVYYLDFWEYNPEIDTWIRKADFPGGERLEAIGFSIGSKGYVCCGSGGQPGNFILYTDLWEYDQSIDTWTQKANFPGLLRFSAVGFSIGSKGYFGTGIAINDFWEYNPSTNTWTQKADFPGTSRTYSVGFSNGIKGFIGTGSYDMGYLKDFWEYDPLDDSWTQKADFGGDERTHAVGFSVNSIGFISTGSNELYLFNDLWQYNDSSDSWTQKPDFPGIPRIAAIAFSIGSKGYIGTGQDATYTTRKDFYEFDPQVTNTNVKNIDYQLTLSPNPACNYVEISTPQIGIIEIFNGLGQISTSLRIEPQKTFIDLSKLSSGLYVVKIKFEHNLILRKLIKE